MLNAHTVFSQVRDKFFFLPFDLPLKAPSITRFVLLQHFSHSSNSLVSVPVEVPRHTAAVVSVALFYWAH